MLSRKPTRVIMRSLVPWWTLWVLCIAWVVSLFCSRTMQVVTLVWAVVSFLIRCVVAASV